MADVAAVMFDIVLERAIRVPVPVKIAGDLASGPPVTRVAGLVQAELVAADVGAELVQPGVIPLDIAIVAA